MLGRVPEPVNRFGLQMRDHGCVPVVPASAEEIAERLADSATWAPVEDRDAYADGLLAWAETVGFDVYARYRLRVFQVEIDRHAREWAEAYADETFELGVLKIEAVFQAITDQHGRTPDEGYEGWFGPGIPTIVQRVVDALHDAKRDGREQPLPGGVDVQPTPPPPTGPPLGRPMPHGPTGGPVSSAPPPPPPSEPFDDTFRL